MRDLDFLEGYINTMIWSYGYNGPLVFRSNPTTNPTFTPVEVRSFAEFNSGEHALSAHSSNTEHLEHEKWLISMLAEVDTLPTDTSSDVEVRQAQLFRTLRHELSRLQTHKEVEWRRQRATIASCENKGAPFFDTGEHHVNAVPRAHSSCVQCIISFTLIASSTLWSLHIIWRLS